MTGQRRCVVLASVVAALAGAAPGHAETSTATPALTVVGQAEGPQKLPVAKTTRGQRLSAALPVVVRNDSDTVGTLEAIMAQQQGGAEVRVDPQGASAPANGIVAITLRFTATGKAASIDGTVLLRLKGEPAVKP